MQNINLSNRQKTWLKWLLTTLIVAAMAYTGVTFPNAKLPPLPEEEELVTYGFQTDCYSTNGGDKWVCKDSGEIEMQTGTTLDIQSGATASFANSTLGPGKFAVDATRDAVTGNESIVTFESMATGVTANSKTRLLELWMGRDAGDGITVGDMADYGLFIRVETEATTTTAGTVLRAVDAEAKADNPSGTVTNLNGGTFTAKSDSGAGAVSNMTALAANAHTGTQANAATAMLLAGDFRIARFSATEPTEEYILHLRSGSEAGTGADAAMYIESDFSGQTDDFNYGIDMSSADIDNGDIRFQNGTVLEETTDTILTFSEFLGGAEQTAEVVSGGSTIVPTGTFQPISSSGVVTCSTGTCITAGTQDGQLLILQNVNASDAITIDGTGGNVECKSDVVLGARDTLGLLWNGAEWNCLFYYDNS